MDGGLGIDDPGAHRPSEHAAQRDSAETAFDLSHGFPPEHARGALHHHSKGKGDLFAAVHEPVQGSVVAESLEPDPWTARVLLASPRASASAASG